MLFFGAELMTQITFVVDKLREYAHSRKFWRHVQFGGVRTNGKIMPK